MKDHYQGPGFLEFFAALVALAVAVGGMALVLWLVFRF